MQIVILGAGRVGQSVTERLHSNADTDITVVDTNGDKLRRLQDLCDIKTVIGNAAHPGILRQAGAEDAELVLAVTANDAVNLVACRICKNTFNTPNLVARIRDEELGKTAEELFGVNFVFFPEQVVTNYILDSIQHPNCLQVHKFAKGRVLLGVVKVTGDKIPTETSIETIQARTPDVDFRIVAIYRGNLSVFPDGKTDIVAGDEVFFVSDTDNFDKVVNEFSDVNREHRSIFISGGGNVGLSLAKALERDHKVKILERSRERCAYLSRSLKRTLVLCGDATDENLAREEGFGESDVYCAVTNDDETNVMSSLLAKRMGAAKLVVLVNRASYVDVLQDNDIDIAIPPAEVTTGPLLTYIRQADVTAVHLLRRGAAEALEAVLHGTEQDSNLVGRPIKSIAWPPNVMPGAIVRDDKVCIAHNDLVLQQGDHVIVFVSQRDSVRKTVKFLSAGAGFF